MFGRNVVEKNQTSYILGKDATGIRCALSVTKSYDFLHNWTKVINHTRIVTLRAHFLTLSMHFLNKVPADDTFIGVLVTHTRKRCQAIKADKWRTVWTDSTDCCLSEKMSQYTISIESFCSLLTYTLTPWSRFLLEKLTGLQLIKKFPAFYGTRRFITVFTSARHLSLSWASSVQSIPPHSTS